MAGMGCAWSRCWRPPSGRWRRTGCRSPSRRPSTTGRPERAFMSEQLTALIVSALREQGGGREVATLPELGSETPLFGREGVLDSLGLVALVVAVEQAIEDEYGVSVSLADERALSEGKSPFRTVGALADYAGRLIDGGR